MKERMYSMLVKKRHTQMTSSFQEACDCWCLDIIIIENNLYPYEKCRTCHCRKHRKAPLIFHPDRAYVRCRNVN
uniref:Uncharacterized protein n=1 Tax=Cannabis sativa TaxID=3483 RepID=A0A803R3H2_CANSA